MTEPARRGVTRGYVGGLILASVIVALALVVALWGMLALASGGAPVSTPGIPLAVAPMLVLLAALALGWGLWQQSLTLLRGQRSPAWSVVISVAAGGYLIWCLGGLAVGLEIADTWTSGYPALLALIWAITALLAWAVLARRVFTNRPTPQWPWERRGDPGPDGPSPDAAPWRPRE